MYLTNFAKMDPHLLLSIVNMKLRNENIGLASLCNHYEINQQLLLNKLESAGFYYQADINQFRILKS
ncbi:DUF4250 domain-containing protein [Catenovulum adriaticum]|uniref:DUF4250 domain-containing protein n=1 Tax=Catenovulum adriaticum TaxID=2984846 RepID=A0ABY7AP49_9ALTE|nr:DUF4250 domain-containing protein [Catenovulum sp. TS8]WAJ70084.1 DUF4250 domain-containing protein [Catenovulum sp. TS8]